MRLRAGQPASDAPTAIAPAPVTLSAIARSAGVFLDDTPAEGTFRARLPSDLMLTTPGTRDAYRPGWDAGGDLVPDEGDEYEDGDLVDGGTYDIDVDADETQERASLGPDTPPTAIRVAPVASRAVSPRPLAVGSSPAIDSPSLGSLPVVPSYPSSSPSSPSSPSFAPPSPSSRPPNVVPDAGVTRRAPAGARLVTTLPPALASAAVRPPVRPPARPLAFPPLPVVPVPASRPFPVAPDVASPARSAARWVVGLLLLAFASGMVTTFGVEAFSAEPTPLDRRPPRAVEMVAAKRSAQGGAAGKREAAPASSAPPAAPAVTAAPRVRHRRRPAPIAVGAVGAPGVSAAPTTTALLRADAPASVSVGSSVPPPSDTP